MRHRKPRVMSRIITVDGKLFLIGRRDEDGFEAVRLVGKDLDTVIRMREENEIEMEEALLRRR